MDLWPVRRQYREAENVSRLSSETLPNVAMAFPPRHLLKYLVLALNNGFRYWLRNFREILVDSDAACISQLGKGAEPYWA